MGRTKERKPLKNGSPRPIRKDKGVARGSRKGGLTQKEALEKLNGISNGISQYDQKTVRAPTLRFPESHPHWSTFTAWVRTSGVVRKDLLDSHPDTLSSNDWEQVWSTWLGGLNTGLRIASITPSGVSKS